MELKSVWHVCIAPTMRCSNRTFMELKYQKRTAVHAPAQQVAPYVGAWIETGQSRLLRNTSAVAPYVGAWIKTQSLQCPSQHDSITPNVGEWMTTKTIKR